MNLKSLLKDTCYDHPRQVARISELLAGEIGYTSDETDIIRVGALCHDIGKSEIPKEILNKTGGFTADEFRIMKSHTELGYRRIMKLGKECEIVANICRDHHERLDGSGYRRLTGDEIHPFSKLIAVADVFDALYSKRIYKTAWSIDRIYDYFTQYAKAQFDPKTVEALLSKLFDVIDLYRQAISA